MTCPFFLELCAIEVTSSSDPIISVSSEIFNERVTAIAKYQIKELNFVSLKFLALLSHVFGHEWSCPDCGVRCWVVDSVLRLSWVRRALLALGIDRSPIALAPARGPPSLW
jgi:hypothetical protein